MSTDSGNHDPVEKARAVLREAIEAAGLSQFAAMAVLAASESYIKVMVEAELRKRSASPRTSS